MEDHNKNNREYEFNDGENSIISRLASAMKFVGICTIVMGVLSGLGGVLQLGARNGGPQALGSFIQAVLFVVIGGMTTGASSYFSQIVNTQGNDMSNLMLALDKLRGIYSLQRVLFIIVIVLIGLAFLLLLAAAPRY